MLPAFGAAGVGVLVLLYLVLTPSPPAKVAVIQPPVPVVTPTVVVQQMVPSVLSPSPPAGATVQEVEPTPVAPPPQLASAPAVQPGSSQRAAGRTKSGSEAATRKRVENGTVAIGASGGWADVFLGTRRLGTTPVVATLPAGSHTLTVYPFGKGPAQRSRVEVKAGAQTKHKIDLGR